jgi:hypothetical protein
MDSRNATREQRDAARTKAMRATGSAEPSASAVWHGHHGTGPLRHVHVVIDGRLVEVTEDDFGVTELHLE